MVPVMLLIIAKIKHRRSWKKAERAKRADVLGLANGGKATGPAMA